MRRFRLGLGWPFSSSSTFRFLGAFGFGCGVSVPLPVGCSASSSLAAVWLTSAKKEKPSAQTSPDQQDPSDRGNQGRTLVVVHAHAARLQCLLRIGRLLLPPIVLTLRGAALTRVALRFLETLATLLGLSQTLLELVVVEEQRDDLVRLGRTLARGSRARRADDRVLNELLVPASTRVNGEV